MVHPQDLQDLRSELLELGQPCLSVYADVHPARPENANGAWRTRIKNALKEIPELREPRKHDPTMEEAVLAMLEGVRPDARTLAIFAAEDTHHRLHTRRLELDVDLPVVDLAHGRVEAMYGRPLIAPLLYAIDEYERSGVLVASRECWRFFEYFLGQCEERTGVFSQISEDEWARLRDASERIRSGALKERPAMDRDRVDDRHSAWMHRLHATLAGLVHRVVGDRQIDRLLLVGEDWQTRVLGGAFDRSLRRRVAAHVPLEQRPQEFTPGEVKNLIEPVLEKVEREQEMTLLAEIRESGVHGTEKTIEALQMGRLDVWVLPWNLDMKIWQCANGAVGATREAAERWGDDASEVALRQVVTPLSESLGTRLEFVRGEPEKVLISEMGGMAGRLRW